MQALLLFSTLVLFSSQALAGNPIQFAILNDSDEEEFATAVATQGIEYEFNSAGESYLHTMARLNRAKQIGWILQHERFKRCLYMADDFNRSPLERAVQSGSVEAFRVLYHHEIVMLRKDLVMRHWQAGFTLYHMAAYYNQPGIIGSLRDMGGVPYEIEGKDGGWNALNDAHETALDVAIRMGAKDAEKALRYFGARSAKEIPGVLPLTRTQPTYVHPVDPTEVERLAQADAEARVLEQMSKIVSDVKSLFAQGVGSFVKLF